MTRRLPFFVLFCLLPSYLPAAPCPPLSLLPRELPEGKEGIRYEHRLVPIGGAPPVRMMILEGLLPPGISLSPDGFLSGTPRGAGDYRVTVSVSDSCSPLPQESSQKFVVRIGDTSSDGSGGDRKRKLLLTPTTPQRHTLRGGEHSVRLLHRFTASPPDTALLSSPGVSFLVDGSVVRSVSLPLDLMLINGEGEVEETLEIPAEVFRSAERGGGSIVVNRPFVGRGTTGGSVVTLILPTGESGGEKRKGGAR